MLVKQEFFLTEKCKYVAQNYWDDDVICIEIYLRRFKFRKNVALREVIYRLNKAYMIELLCAIARSEDEDGRPPCELLKKSACPCHLTIY